MRTAWNPGRLSGAGTAFDWWQAQGFSRAPFAAFPAGAGSPIAGSAGLALSRFGWLNTDTGEASNVYAAGSFLGFVLPVPQLLVPPLRYPSLTFPCGVPTLRPGMRCVIASQGAFVTRCPLGAQAGNAVWTDPATGLPYGSNLTGGYIQTRWTVAGTGECNARLRISSFLPAFN